MFDITVNDGPSITDPTPKKAPDGGHVQNFEKVDKLGLRTWSFEKKKDQVNQV